VRRGAMDNCVFGQPIERLLHRPLGLVSTALLASSKTKTGDALLPPPEKRIRALRRTCRS
jgi:hypothetical protein